MVRISLPTTFFRQVVDRIESDVREQLCDSHRLLARTFREPRKVLLQAFSGGRQSARKGAPIISELKFYFLALGHFVNVDDGFGFEHMFELSRYALIF